jgi:hypothetical protein
MSESFVNPLFGRRAEPATDVEPEGTGDRAVDTVVASLDSLDELSVADHVAVFEQAHETLRRTLAGANQGNPAGRS